MTAPGSAALRVAFAGTPEFASAALTAIHAAGFQVPLVLTQPDRPAGRGMKLQASAVKQEALRLGLPLAQPRSLRLDGKYPDDAREAQQALAAAMPDVLVVAAYGLILPAWTLTLPALGCLNIHASLLPRWRGAAPIHRAIEAGDSQTGITIMQMDEGLDTGDMLLIEREPIHSDDTTATLHDRLAALGASAIVRTLQALPQPGWPRQPQPEQGVCYAHKIDKAEARIDWHQPAELLARRVRAFDPFPGAQAQGAGADGAESLFKVWAAQALPGGAATSTEPGTVLAAGPDGLEIACGQGRLLLTQLQRPGGKRVSAREFLTSHPVKVGTRLT